MVLLKRFDHVVIWWWQSHIATITTQTSPNNYKRKDCTKNKTNHKRIEIIASWNELNANDGISSTPKFNIAIAKKNSEINELDKIEIEEDLTFRRLVYDTLSPKCNNAVWLYSELV